MIYTPGISVMRQLAGTRDYAVRGGVGEGAKREMSSLGDIHTDRVTDR